MKFYCGVGSRSTPKVILYLMSCLAQALEDKGYTLRSGGAKGADYAFGSSTSNKHIYIPWKGYNGITDAIRTKPELWAFEIASKVHPAWYRCTPGVKKLHARNVHQVLGDKLHPAKCEFLICWTKNGALVGGTATAIRLAKENNIKVYNLANNTDRTQLIGLVDITNYKSLL